MRMKSYSDLVDERLVLSLAEVEEQPCISITIPTEEVGSTQKSSIFLSNAMKDLEAEARREGIDLRGVDDKLDHIRALVHNSLFWTYQSKTLTLYVSPSVFEVRRLPVIWDYDVRITNHFALLPLLEALEGNAFFYVLSLSRASSHLFLGTRRGLSEVTVHKLPSMNEALYYVEREAQLQFHSGATLQGEHGPRGGAWRRAMFFGHGANTDQKETKELISEYFRKLDVVVQDIIGASHLPLILAGAEALHPIYKGVSSYPHIAEDGVPGNFEESGNDELLEKALDAAQPLFDKRTYEDVIRYREISPRELTAEAFEDVLPAAYWGMVDVLFVPRRKTIAGVFHKERPGISFEPAQKRSAPDLYTLAALYCYRNGGSVHIVREDELPARPMAAILRYPIPIGPMQRAQLAERPETRLH